MSDATETVRLEYDDGAGTEFLSVADAVFHLAYGVQGGGMRGVTGLRAVTRHDAYGDVIDGVPALVHPDDEIGEILYDRESLQALVDQAHEHDDTPAAGGPPDESTAAAVASIVEDA